MAEPTLDELVAFMKKHGAEKVDSITDEKSAIKHFRATSRVYKQERDSLLKQRDELINDMVEIKKKAEAYDKIKEAVDNQRLNDCSLYDNDSFIDRLHHVFDEMGE
ncbi:hypothetical protein [Staphylococcus phage vB_SepM_ phiIPLA-C1C]|jgi:ORF030|uniref:Uncharacterized protein n=1 Tax=Staphylococcus phage vB_SepM_ phiIPLA-C1C TaxID=1572704 RepID=A0A0D3MVN3_9CAUD|nr:hypothetical protein AVU40_gp123 [Staphylococcus phage phiIPLA-C1C]AJA42298.1 hypothetical protein [Staphylococcus phage phiIPLA-C1C]